MRTQGGDLDLFELDGLLRFAIALGADQKGLHGFSQCLIHGLPTGF